MELTLTRNPSRFAAEGFKQRASHPAHEAAMTALPPNLRILRMDHCQLRTFPTPVPTSLEELYGATNHFLVLPDLSAAANLAVLELEDCDIDNVDNPLPPLLVRLNLRQNAIHYWTLATPPPALASVELGGNPSFPLPLAWYAVWQPFTVRAAGAGAGAGAGALQAGPPVVVNVYKNAHNVHDSGVQASTRASIRYLVDYRLDVPEDPRLFETMDATFAALETVGGGRDTRSCLSRLVQNFPRVFPQPPVGPGAQLRRYATASADYSMHGVQFTQLVDRVWLRIQDTSDAERKAELMRRLREEVGEGVNHCTNGMMVRLTNVFIGFDDNVSMTLQPRQVLQSRIPATMERLRRTLEVQPGYEAAPFWAAVYVETVKDLMDLGVGKPARSEDEGVFAAWDVHTWAEWLQPLSEPVLEELWEKKIQSGEALWQRDVADTVLQEAVQRFGLRGFLWEVAALRSLVRASYNAT